MGATTKDGLDIAKKSRDIVKIKIKNVLGEEVVKYSNEEISIIERVVHATADEEYAELIKFNNNPIENGIEGLKNNCSIVVDIGMVEAGIRYDRVYNFIKDKETLKIAEEEQITRAAAAMRVAKSHIDEGIVVIGNAPTALYEVIRLTLEGEVNPKLIVGVPVGYVKASESKELLCKTKIPSITTTGPKGGTPVAVAIINGIIALSKNERV
ncbi:MAG TPA: cobalt-precorrin-8 methylmutase [Methanothermococcus okinawensis]|uniref:Cobalt-precorrin-8 methylmutase n=1 Tax=Methanothermococcus okinawensis TaxID=155863 RepID=A0A833DQG3_9EURY|nr:cobalt-precorrin-8 methylmutase [Methanothermococcus okinawensis]